MNLSAQPAKPTAPQPYLNRRDVKGKCATARAIRACINRWHIAGCLKELRR